MNRSTARVALNPDGFALAGRPRGPDRLPGHPCCVPVRAYRSTRRPLSQPEYVEWVTSRCGVDDRGDDEQPSRDAQRAV